MTKEKDEWGNLELPGLSDDKLFETNWNYVASNREHARDPEWIKRQKEGIVKKTQTKEWKENQLSGTQTIRANNKQWQENVRSGAQKREDNAEFKILRKEINGNQQNNPLWIEGIRKGMKDRWSKEKNLSTCPHCGKTTDNANYKRWHGDNCKKKLK